MLLVDLVKQYIPLAGKWGDRAIEQSSDSDFTPYRAEKKAVSRVFPLNSSFNPLPAMV
ncbi:hypothetical protein [Candidatus Symbiopectobacterium sp. NZEC135]|uniref:hypothetical protein n=1 Tax=Candidatus Symbiopectobacterium sp. NZEC135 TaxID=2820471 RepID=UPI002226C2DB|nr:hypothetical protein [Candidatus Symbiopectobacterium sp. NZEC135]MCW2478470.1 hypothetical protein [Candidatus Symbiopectobacterium sp. NZEC135]